MNEKNNDPLAQKLIDKRKAQAITEASLKEHAAALSRLKASIPAAILEEFGRIGQRLQRMSDNLPNEEDIKLVVSEQSIQFLDVNISFLPQNNQLKDETSSIHVTKGGNGPEVYFGIRNNNNQICWRHEKAKRTFTTEQLIESLL